MSTIKLKGSSSGEAAITVPAAAGTPTFILPSTVGTAGEVLKNSSTAGTFEFGEKGKILQVVQGIKKDTSSNSTSAGYWYNTDVTLSIIPNHANNKILLTGYVSVGIAGPQHNIGCGIHKAGNVISDYNADAAGSRSRVPVTGDNMPDGGYTNAMAVINFEYLDTAGGTSAITYGIALRNPSSISRTFKINYAETDTDSSNHYRATSVITAMEVEV